jgi:hypothetical protein
MVSPKAKTPAASAYANAAAIVAAALFGIAMLWMLTSLRRASTPEVEKATAERTELCDREDFCEAYGETRQACATAGDFANCIRVKIGDKNLGRLGYCANEGGLASPPQDRPSSFECFRHRWGM